MRFEIFHNVGFTNLTNTEHRGLHVNEDDEPCGQFHGFCTNCSLRPVTRFKLETRNPERDLDYIWTAMQNDGPGVPPRYRYIQPKETRSLSVGDVIVADEDQAWRVASIGFDPVDPADVRRAVENFQVNDAKEDWLSH